MIAIGGCLGDGAEKCIKEGVFNECYAVNNVLGIDDSDPEQVRTAMKPGKCCGESDDVCRKDHRT